jgi:hypothetical protein
VSLSVPQQFHLPHLYFKPLSALYISFTLRFLSISLVSVFVPIYILNLTGDFLYILLFWAIFSILVVLFAIPSGYVVSKLGFRRSVFVASVFLAFEFYLFSILDKNPILLYVIPAVEAAKLLLFWVPYHLIFIKDGSDGCFGRQISVVGMIGRLVSAVAPFFGGLVIIRSGFPNLFYMALVLVLISSLPLFAMPHHPPEHFPGWRHILRNTLTCGYGRMFLAFWGFRIPALVAAIVWPVFLFGIVSGSYEEVGIITSAVLLISAAVMFISGRASDKIGRRRVLRVGALVNSAIWMVKAFVKTPIQAFAADSFNKLVDGIQGVPFEALTYHKALKRKHPLEFIVRREILLHFGGLITILLMMGLWRLGTPITTFFVIASVGYLVSTLLISSK